MSRLEERWHSLIQKRGPLQSLLGIASWGYRVAIHARNTLYDRHLLTTHPSPLPTLSVGNLLLGGSGKTPLVRHLAQNSEGKVAILSRGYKSEAEKCSTPTLVTADSSWKEVGDEPLMLAKSLPAALIIVCADRLKGANFAKELGADLLILDDGFQHRRLAREPDIVCIPASTPLTSLRLFPRGTLREPLTSLKRATTLAITECVEGIPLELAEALSHYTSAPQVGYGIRASVYNRDGEAISIAGKQVAIFCGIARPERFAQTVEGLGGHVVAQIHLPDHGALQEEELSRLQASNPDLILCTEKDWIKGVSADGYIHLAIYQIKN